MGDDAGHPVCGEVVRPRGGDDTAPATRGLRRAQPAIYGAMHLVVDASTVAVVFAAAVIHDLSATDAFGLVIAYDILAFGSQALFGHATDRLRAPRGAVLVGLALTALAFGALPLEPTAAMILAGLGNALFHVGAGAITLNTDPGRATDPGVFVAPGALGLAIGLYVGRSGAVQAWPFLLALSVSFAATLSLRCPPMPYARAADHSAGPGASDRGLATGAATLVVTLLLLSISVRSFVGLAGCRSCPASVWITIGLPLAAFLGKGLGGVISDRLGWIETSVGALLLSAPLLAFAEHTPAAVLIGLLLFQMTMPVTLVALALVFPRRPAFAFGVAAVALVLGALPTFYAAVRAVLYPYPLALFALILASAGAVLVSLLRLGGRIPPGRLLPRL